MSLPQSLDQSLAEINTPTPSCSTTAPCTQAGFLCPVPGSVGKALGSGAVPGLRLKVQGQLSARPRQISL